MFEAKKNSKQKSAISMGDEGVLLYNAKLEITKAA
jgi:hypothetical protein